MDDKFIQALHSELSSSYELGTVEEFGKKLASDDVFRKALFEDASKTLDLGDYATFEGQVKKKVSTVFPLPSIENLQKDFQKRQQESGDFSVVPQPDNPEEERETTVVGDLLRTLKSTSLKALGGITAIPNLGDKTIDRLIGYPIAKALAPDANDDEIKSALASMGELYPASSNLEDLAKVGAGAQDKLMKVASRTDAKMKQIEGGIIENFKQGNVGDAFEQLARGVVGTIPYLAEVAATAGGGAAAVLSTIGATAASQQYGEIKGREDLSEGKKVFNSWLYGGFEAAGELVTAGILNRTFRVLKGAGAQPTKEVTEGLAKSLLKKFGVIGKEGGSEAGSEMITQVGQNLTAMWTGEDPNRRWHDGVLDAGLIGFVPGAGMGTIQAAVAGRAIATKEEVDAVNESHAKQAAIIEQIEAAENTETKEVLEQELIAEKDNEQSVIEANIEVAKTMTEGQLAEVSKLQTARAELDAKISDPALPKEERANIESISKGIDEQIIEIREATPKVDNGASDIAPRIEGKTESGTQVSPQGDMPPLTTPSELNTGEIQGDVIPVKRISELREQSHTKGVFVDETGKLYKSVEIKGGETMEHEVIAQNQDLSIMPAVGNIRNTSEGRAFEIERLSPLEEEDNITLDEYRAIVADAKKLDDRNIFVSESPDLARDKNGAVKLLDFSMSRNKAKAEKGDTNYSSEVLIASAAYDHLSQNDKNVISHENEIGRKNKLNKITKKDTPVETKGFLYSLTARPFSKGTFPEDGFVTLVSENEKKKDGSFGVMEFSRPLTQKEVDKYELRFDGRSANDYTAPAPQTQEEVPETTNVGEGTIAETAQVGQKNKATPLKVEEESRAIPLNNVQKEVKVERTARDIARENLKAKWDNLKNIGVIYDPRSQAKAQVEFTQALLEYIRQEVLDTVGKIKSEVKDIFGHDLSDADAEYLLAKSKGDEVPPAEPPVVEQTKQPEGDNTFERETLRKMRDESTLSPEFKEWLGNNGITTTRLPNNVTSAEVDYIIASNGLDKASIILKDSGNNLPLAVRNLMGVRLAKAYDDLAVAAGQNGDLEGENLYRVKALEIAHWIGDTSTDTARGLQILGSTEALGILSPKTLVMNAEREARRQRDKGISKSKKDIASKKKSLSEAQEEAVDELISKPKYKEEKRKVTRGEVGARKQVPKDVLAKERKFRETKWAELRKAREAAKGRDKSIGFAATPLHADEVAIAGEIVRSYVRSGYYKIEDIVKRLQKEWKKFMGDDLDYDTAVTLIPKETDGKPTEDLMKENAEEKAAETLSKRVIRMLDDPKTPKDDPIKLMVNTLFAKVKEKDTKKPELKKKSDIEKIREAILNKKEYAGVWEEAKKLVDFMISSNENLSEETKADYTQRLQKFYDEVIGKPYNEGLVAGSMQEIIGNVYNYLVDKIEKKGFNINDIRGDIVEKIIYETGATEENASLLADDIIRYFNEKTSAIRERNAERQRKAEERKAEIAIKAEQKRIKGANKPIWGTRKKQAARNLVKKLDNTLPSEEKTNPALLEFTNRLSSVYLQKAKEVNPKGDEAKAKISKKDILKEIFDNINEYRDVISEARDYVREEYGNNLEMLIALDEYLGQISDKPFSDRLVKDAMSDAMKELDIRLDEIVKQHYTVYDATRRTLQEKLVDDLGLSEEDAQMFADAVGREFDKIATAKKKAALLRGIKPKETVHPKQAKATWEKLIELSNMGAWSDAEFSEAYAEKWGMPALTEEQAKAIEAFAKLVQETPEGYKKFERTQDMLAYIAKLNGMDVGDVGMALWYASILSGPRTQFKNVFANMANTLFEFVVSARRPQFIKALIYGLGTGWGHGAREAFHILYSGYSPIRMGKIEVPMVLEQWKFKGRGYNPLNWGKYVARVMMAADAFSYHGLKEMRAWELAMLEARKEDVKAQHPSKKQWAIATELLYRTSDRKAEAMAKAEAEGLKSRSNEYWRRVWEIMEKSRPLQVEEETNHFASRGTFNHAPEGTMGLLTDAISHFTQNVAKLSFTIPFTQKDVTIRPLKFVIPFTRIISNVANTAIDYTPYGFMRAKSGGIGFISYEDSVRTAKYRREYTPDEKGREYAKATIGLIAMTGLYILSGDSDDDDREPIITITANGTGDYRKNYELKEKGWQAYSIKIRGTKRWFSYQYTPLFLALAPIGYLRDIEKYHKEDAETMKWTDTLEAIVSQTMSAMSDMSWMASAAGLMEALSSNDIKTFDRWWQNMAMSTGKSVMYPKLAEQIVQMIDNATMNPRKDATGLTGKMLKDIPIARKGYNDMLNAVGEPIMYDPYMMIEKETTDPFWNYVVKNNAWIGKPTQKATIVFDGEVERGLTDDEYYQYIRLSGQAIRNRIENEVMTKELPQEEVVKAVNSIKTEERKRAREMMFGWSGLRTEYPEAWAFLTKNNLLPTRSTVKINDQTLTDPKLVDEYWDEVEVQFAKFMKNRKDVALSPAARARWEDEINGESGLWGKAQKVVDSKWRTKTLSQIE